MPGRLAGYRGYLAALRAIAGYFAHLHGLEVTPAVSLAAPGYFLLVRRCGAPEAWGRPAVPAEGMFTPGGRRAVLAAGRSAGGFLT